MKIIIHALLVVALSNTDSNNGSRSLALDVLSSFITDLAGYRWDLSTESNKNVIKIPEGETLEEKKLRLLVEGQLRQRSKQHAIWAKELG